MTAESILRHVSDGDLLLQLSVAPDTRLRYQLPYREDLAVLKARYPGNPYLEAPVYEWQHDNTGGQASQAAVPSPSSSTAPLVPQAPATTAVNESQQPYLVPYHAAAVIDPRIQSARPSQWTSVTHDDELMRSLLGSYSLYEHHGYNFFHKDYFLDDMNAMRRRFCSKLLVNCVLAHACVRFSPCRWTKGLPFFLSSFLPIFLFFIFFLYNHSS
jgi:hypothetical protein